MDRTAETDAAKAVVAETGEAPADADRHWDGTHFFNPGSRPARSPGLRAVIRFRVGRRRVVRERWPVPPPDPVFPPFPRAVAPGTAAACFVGHASFVIRLPAGVVLTDPIFSARCSPVRFAGPKRIRPPGVPLEALPAPSVVLVSHGHYDHLDLPSLRVIRRRHPGAVFVTLRGNGRTLRRAGIEAVELDWWEVTDAAPGLRVTATPARHFSARTPWDFNRSLWGGFMIEDRDGGRVFFAGDSGDGPHWATIRARLGAPDLALLPIGATLPRAMMRPVHMDATEAVAAHRTLGARRSIGMHFGTFVLSAEAPDAPPRALARARDAVGLPAAAFDTLASGETAVVPIGTRRPEAARETARTRGGDLAATPRRTRRRRRSGTT